jgi:hypothetical protein
MVLCAERVGELQTLCQVYAVEGERGISLSKKSALMLVGYLELVSVIKTLAKNAKFRVIADNQLRSNEKFRIWRWYRYIP